MKNTLAILFAMFIICSVASAQDTLYIYQAGSLVLKRSVSDIDSITFAQSEQDMVVDVDGNIYSTVLVGSQTWLAANLRTSKYNDNSPIPMVTEGTD
ncbi:hypothetical protein [Roseimarinus sediminis]|uniref:hypothetical protein n=1 Tax=Roseimarinus sediminis TaxID=1610899 RepID=UPI003D2080BA